MQVWNCTLSSCHRGGCFKALVHNVLIGRKKALLWALDSPPPHPLPRRPSAVAMAAGVGQGGEAVARYIHNTSARSWDQTKRIREPDDYSTLQDWGRLLALESQVRVRAGWPIICSRGGRFFFRRAGDKKKKKKVTPTRRKRYQKFPFRYKREWTLCCYCEATLILTRWTLESLALKAASSRLFTCCCFFYKLGPFRPAVSKHGFSFRGGRRIRLDSGLLQPLFLTVHGVFRSVRMFDSRPKGKHGSILR